MPRYLIIPIVLETEYVNVIKIKKLINKSITVGLQDLERT